MKRSLYALIGSTFLLLFFLFSTFGAFKNGAVLSQERIRSTAHIVPQNQAGIIHVDVGQGDAAILISKERKAMVIDSGDNAVSYAYPNMKRILDDNNLKELEYVVLSHPHQDHIGNTLSLLNDYDTRTVVLNGAVSTNETYQKILSFIDNENIATSFVKKGDSFSL
ncbi:MAG TPA: MBL fold metallo-hydrolase, partial [Patescibacteria group bacterium]|nr:MBL fold metallo-hydrolase [Patescibacteria group bacterium]